MMPNAQQFIIELSNASAVVGGEESRWKERDLDDGFIHTYTRLFGIGM